MFVDDVPLTTRSSSSALSLPLTEDNIVQALTEHARKIATSVLSNADTGTDLAGDAQVGGQTKVIQLRSIIRSARFHSWLILCFLILHFEYDNCLFLNLEFP